jgi:hypothetical protein
MNKIPQQHIKSVFTFFSLAILVLFFSSCTKQIAFQSSSIVPAARGNG